jgi:hypothetical protein
MPSLSISSQISISQLCLAWKKELRHTGIDERLKHTVWKVGEIEESGLCAWGSYFISVSENIPTENGHEILYFIW